MVARHAQHSARRLLAIQQHATALAADEPAGHEPPTVDPPRTAAAPDLIPCRRPRRRDDCDVAIASHGLRSQLDALGLPPRTVRIAGREGVSDLVKERI